MNQKDTINFILAGVGGHGTILASYLLASVGLEAGFDVKQAEVRGMAQGGGRVSSHVRWGPVVYSPLRHRQAPACASKTQVEAVCRCRQCRLRSWRCASQNLKSLLAAAAAIECRQDNCRTKPMRIGARAAS